MMEMLMVLISGLKRIRNSIAVPLIGLYNNSMLIKKEYLLLSAGGPNGQIWDEISWFDDVDEVLDYCNREEICDDNGVRFRNSYDEKNWEREDYICEVYADEIEGKIVGSYLINEGLELLEIVD